MFMQIATKDLFRFSQRLLASYCVIAEVVEEHNQIFRVPAT